MKIVLLILAAALLSSCVSNGNLTLQGDLTGMGIPAKFSYQSGGKNPIYSK